MATRTGDQPAGVDARPYSVDKEQIESFLRASHIVVMPSREEGFGLVALEAIEANRPIVASSESGFAEWLRQDSGLSEDDLALAEKFLIVKLPPKVLKSKAQALADKLLLVYEEFDVVLGLMKRLRAATLSKNWDFAAEELVQALELPAIP